MPTRTPGATSLDKLATYSIDLNAGTCGNTALPTISISDATCRAGEVTQSQVTVGTDGALKPLPLRDGRERMVQLYLIFADRDAAGPGVRRLAEIVKEEMAKVQKDCGSGTSR